MISTDDVFARHPELKGADRKTVDFWVGKANVGIKAEQFGAPFLNLAQIEYVGHQVTKPPLNHRIPAHDAPHVWSHTAHGARLMQMELDHKKSLIDAATAQINASAASR